MRTVSFGKAQELRDNDFEQPELRNLQMWYDLKGTLYKIRDIEFIDGAKEAQFDPWDKDTEGWRYSKALRLKDVGVIIYAPTIEDLLRLLPNKYREQDFHKMSKKTDENEADEYADAWIAEQKKYK